MNTKVAVTPEVLIPRMETEQLTEMILNQHPPAKVLSVLDIGTGSGCIAIALKTERPDWNITAIDKSEKALHVAIQNAAQQNVDICFMNINIHQKLLRQLSAHSFDLIVSNPPYILAGEKTTLERQVRNYEPPEALFCQNITNEYQMIAKKAAALLKKDGILYLEINEKYPDAILSGFDIQKWHCTLKKDYDKNPRFITARLRN